MSGNLLYDEVIRLSGEELQDEEKYIDVDGTPILVVGFDLADHFTVLKDAVVVLSEPMTLDFTDQYNRIHAHHCNVIGLCSYYADVLRRVDNKEKQDRAQLDGELTGNINPATKKVYPREAIKAQIDAHKLIKEAALHSLRYRANLSLVQSMSQHYDRKLKSLENINVNTRREWEAQT
jgi:hypothetical protein